MYYVGFGIKDRKDVDLAYMAADGAIVGTRAIETLEEGLESFEEYIRGLRTPAL